MADVLDLNKRLQAAKAGRGDFEFMLCDAHPESGLLPVVMHDAAGPLLVGIMCPECEAFTHIVNGRPKP